MEEKTLFKLARAITDTGTGYYLFDKGARPQNTSSSDQMYIYKVSQQLVLLL